MDDIVHVAMTHRIIRLTIQNIGFRDVYVRAVFDRLLNVRL